MTALTKSQLALLAIKKKMKESDEFKNTHKHNQKNYNIIGIQKPFIGKNGEVDRKEIANALMKKYGMTQEQANRYVNL